MANKIDLGCAQTRGTFQIAGKVNGRLSQNFFTEGVGKGNRAWRRVHFGVEIEPGKSVYIDLFGSAQDSVYISKRTTVGGKTQVDTQQIPWAKRFDFAKDPKYKGYSVIGITCGCSKIVDSKGIEKNNVKHLTAFDACDEVQCLTDGQDVFIRGNITYSTYNDQHRVNFEPVQISLCRPLDFDDMEYQPTANFTQPLVLMGVTANKETSEYDVAAKIVNYSTVEDTELHISKESAGLAKTLSKLGKYVFVEVHGDITVAGDVVEEVVDSGWGTANKMKRVASPFVRKLMITGADPDSLDKESYSEAIMEHAIEIAASIQNAKKDYGESTDGEDWGKGDKSGNSAGNLDDDEDDDFDLNL